jgi:hypothetical protein
MFHSLFLLSRPQIHTEQYLLYPNVSPACVTAFTSSSYISQKTAASYGVICHGFLDVKMIYLIRW